MHANTLKLPSTEGDNSSFLVIRVFKIIACTKSLDSITTEGSTTTTNIRCLYQMDVVSVITEILIDKLRPLGGETPPQAQIKR